MLRKYAAIYCLIDSSIGKLLSFLDAQMKEGRVNAQPPGKETSFRKILQMLKKEAEVVNLPSVSDQVKRIEANLSAEKFIIKDCEQWVLELRNRLNDELDRKDFLHVPETLVKYYDKAEGLFPEKVITRFSAAQDDIEGAGKCLALGQATACVLHLMRVMEVGLKGLASELKIPYAPSWEAYLKKIQTNIDVPRKKKTKAWLARERFFRDVSGDLISVKQAWRNPTMHVDRKYSAEESEEIFKAVKSFMIRLEAGLNPPLKK